MDRFLRISAIIGFFCNLLYLAGLAMGSIQLREANGFLGDPKVMSALTGFCALFLAVSLAYIFRGLAETRWKGRRHEDSNSVILAGSAVVCGLIWLPSLLLFELAFMQIHGFSWIEAKDGFAGVLIWGGSFGTFALWVASNVLYESLHPDAQDLTSL